MQLAKDTRFDPERTAEAITPLLLELPKETVLSIDADLESLLASETAGLRSAAVALKVRSGAPLGALAERDPKALLDAVAKMDPAQTPDSLPATLIGLAEAGKLDPGAAIRLADNLSSDKAALFERLAALAEPAMDAGYDKWGLPHKLAMAALAGMHQTPNEDWPEGYDAYRIARAEPSVLELGKAVYFKHDQGCYKCHGEKGEGTSGFPAVAGSPMVNGDPIRAAAIVRYGLKGELAHSINPDDGKPFNAQMEQQSHLSNTEMAAALTYVRQNYGNFAPPVTPKDVAAARGPEEGMMWDAEALLAKHPFERDRITGPLPPPSINLRKWTPPAAGMPVMLIVVGFSMLMILGGTYLGKFLQDPHTAAAA